MRTLNKRLSSYCLAVLLATGNMTYTASAYAGERSSGEHSAGGAMLADAVLMRIPYHRDYAVLYSRGLNLVQERPEWSERFLHLFRAIKSEESSEEVRA